MSRTKRYKLQYLIVIAAGVAIAGAAAWSVRERPLAVLGIVVLLLIPGRVSGFLWRDLYRGRRLKEKGKPEASLDSSQRFLSVLTARPWLRGLWWLAWAVYTRDPKAMALNNAGAAQLDLGRFEEAESAFREALTEDPEYPLPHYNLAVLYTVRGEASAAQEHAHAASELGFAGDTSDRIVHAAGALLARIEGPAKGTGS